MSASAAEVIPLGRDEPKTFATAVDAYLRSAGITASSKRIYKISLTTWAWLARGEQAPLGTDRRGATPPAVALAELEAPGAVEAITAAFVERARLIDANTVNRELSVMKAAVA
ncbi:hypothetical protein [Streptosporangium sp. NPDC049046]|uniref:hypothetical protein n=1 Tax=Streptosporangium sp. NPDC049046 TaxID=3155031 RepID=UPI00343F5AE0